MKSARDALIEIRRRVRRGRAPLLTSPLLIWLLVAAGGLLLYLRTLAPGLLTGDSAEFQLAAWRFSLVHPTGYPLYLLAGGAWAHLLPFANPAFRLNLFSALSAAAAAGLTCSTLYSLTKSRAAALIGSFALLTGPTIWRQATEAEVYSLQLLLLITLVLLAGRWVQGREPRQLVAWSFTFGLALAHHRSILLSLPFFILYFVWSRGGVSTLPHITSRTLLLAAAALLLPFSLYAYSPLRAGGTPYLHLPLSASETIITFDTSPPGLWNDFLGTRFGRELRWDAGSLERLRTTPGRVLEEFGPAETSLALFGLGALLRKRRWPLVLLTGGIFLSTVLFASLYHIGDIADYYTPAYLIVAVWIGFGAALCLGISSRLFAHPARQLLAATLLLSLAALPLSRLLLEWPGHDRSGDDRWALTWRTTLSLPLPSNAVLVSNDRDEVVPMWYEQYVEGLQPGWLGLFPLITSSPHHSNVVRLIESVLPTGRPVYLIKPMPGLETRFELESTLLPFVRPLAYPPPACSQVRQVLADLLSVECAFLPPRLNPGEPAQVIVFYRVLRPIARNYTGYLHLLDSEQRKLAQAVDHPIGGSYYPTSLWQVGEITRDTFSIPLPASLPAGPLRLVLGFYTTLEQEPLGDPVQIGVLP